MSPTVRPPACSAASDEEDESPEEASGAWRWTTVVVLPPSIAPVPSSTAVSTATTKPPITPAKTFERTGEKGRGGRLIRRKTRVRRQRHETAQAHDRPAALRERVPQCPPVARRERGSRAGRGVAMAPQQRYVVGGIGARRDLQSSLELGQRGARRVVVSEPHERAPQLVDRPLVAAMEVRPAAQRAP